MLDNASDQLANDAINTIRFLALDAVNAANSGHAGLPMGAATMAFELWTQIMRYNPTNPMWFNRDRFILSAGHGSMLHYALLHLTGYDGMTMDQLRNFRQWGSITPGHPENTHTPGIEVTTGPLGQGFGNGVGMAMAEAYLAARFNRPGHTIIDHYTYAIVSDGDLMEGVSQEAASLAGHLKLGKLIYLYDDNHVTIDGQTSLAFTEDPAARFESYGWHVQKIDGMDRNGVNRALKAAQRETERPSLIAARTIIGFGMPTQGTSSAHSDPISAEATAQTRATLGWPDDAFYVPGEVQEYMRQAVEAGVQAEREWQRQWTRYSEDHPELARELQRMIGGQLPDDWDAELPRYAVGDKANATRNYSGEALNALATRLPELIGGSADLTPSTKTEIKGDGPFEPGHYDQRNVHFGVREHAMGAAVNGMALHGGLLPYGATFMVFTDYFRPSIRLSALSDAHVIWVLTHDSIGVGEDGPTHQPIEQLPSLRMIPNLLVIRPADGNETVAAWREAVAHRDGPTLLSLTRQKVPVLAGTAEKAMEGVARGGYILQDCEGDPDLILMASGSEVQWVVAAAETLSAEDVAVRVVSMPALTRFLEQDAAYRDHVLPLSVRARLAVEAAVPTDWYRVVGLDGEVIGIETFGSSAPGDRVMAEYGFTTENVLNHARRLLEGATTD
ncbi:MAG: transketolase [Anaerolineales bacterium]|nr:transketolase [Anaerolineales bacterium]MCB9127971.1 transketolase [Ardenticatenales bacterium]